LRRLGGLLARLVGADFRQAPLHLSSNTYRAGRCFDMSVSGAISASVMVGGVGTTAVNPLSSSPFPDIFSGNTRSGMDAKVKALKAHRARLKKSGIKRVEVSVPVREAAVIRKAAAVLREQAGEAMRLRQLLGFAPKAARAANGLELFAMTPPLSPAGEALWDAAMERIERDRKDFALNRSRKLAL
jgi:hypothetical protein